MKKDEHSLAAAERDRADPEAVRERRAAEVLADA
jgi:hypothetical protein